MGNVPWDGTRINCYGVAMGQINMSHGQPWDYHIIPVHSRGVFILLSGAKKNSKIVSDYFAV